VLTSTPLARRLPGLDARHATSRARHLRRGLLVIAVLAAVLLLAAVLAVTFVGISGKPHAAHAAHAARGIAVSGTTAAARPSAPLTRTAGASATRTASSPTVTAALEPWQLRAPIDAEVVLPAAPRSPLLEVFGGSTTGNQAAEGIFTLDPSTGALAHVGNLGQPLADATGAVVGGGDLVLGGDTAAPLSSVQGLAPNASGTSTTGSVPLATVVGALPEARAGASAATVGAVTYVVGGTGGPAPDATVLATRDGRAFTTVATLRIPVAFPAVAAVGDKLFVFGGKALAGGGAGGPIATIQIVDLATHRVTIAGRLPVPLAGAAAVTLAGHVFIVGGDTAAVTTSGTVWAFDPSTLAVGTAGRLRVPVAHAGVVVVGGTAWIVGGESNGAPTAGVQTLTP